MDDHRAQSSERKVRPPIPSESERNPSGFRSERNQGRDGKGIEERPKPLAETYSGWMRWAKANLPDEHAPFVAVAARMLKRSGVKPTAENVKRRLEAQGRTKAQLG